MRLTVETGPLAGTQVALDRHHPVTLGSGPDCAIRIAEPGVAAEHAVVKALRDEGFGVKALSAGLRINGHEVEAAPLRDGDVLELGTTRITYGTARTQKGPTITGFKLLGELGKGGMGVVYRAEQVSLHREVALKVLDKKLTDDPQFVAKFVAEARAAAKLSHPNVVHVFDVDQDGGTYFYAMEVMHHGSLEAWLKKHGTMPVERALQVIADAASGLAYAESLGIVHRDIKPDNLMLDQHGTVKIADLGLAFTEADPEEKLAGTPHFMAPEQVLRKGVDHRTDLYALGCTFYRLVTGKTPFRGQTVKDILRAHVKDQAEPAHKLEPSVPAEVSAIIQKLMAKAPDDRYQSATELIAVVGDLLAPKARKGRWIALAAAAVVVAGGAIYWAVTKPSEVVTVVKKYDDPVKQQLADQVQELSARHREDEAMIAFLRARLEAGQDLELARALDEVVSGHPDTKAAGLARALSTQTRDAVAARETAHRRALQLAETALNDARTQAEAAIAAGDLPRALDLTTGIHAQDGADAQALQTGTAALHQQVVDRAAARLAELQQQINGAHAAGDLAAMQEHTAALARIVRAGGWPDALLGDRQAETQRVDAAEAAAQQLADSQLVATWHTFAEFVHGKDGIDAALLRADFGAVAAALAQFAERNPQEPVASHARRLAESWQKAAQFGDLLQAAAERGELQMPTDGDATATLAHWSRDAGALLIVDASHKPAKESTLAVADLALEPWQALARQVAEPADLQGLRAAFLAGIALQRHTAAARTYLAAVRSTDDDSGTGPAGYPLGFAPLETLLGQLPAEATWTAGLRDELAACQLLAQGLRALSERRNLAAATYLERLATEHPHGLCVTALP